MSIIVRIGAVRGIGTTMTSGNEVHLSPHDDDAVEIPPPPDEMCRPQPTSYTSCYGLPYQDHNYNAPPPPTPPQSPIPSPVKILNGHVEIEEVVTTTTTSTNTMPVAMPKDDKFDDSVTRCICQFQHDDGYMICCDKCSVWQHIDCMGIDRNSIPESFFCELCQPREIDVARARLIQMRKREELTGGWDTSATDTDPDEPANHLASLKKKTLTNTKGKVVKQRRISRAKDKVSPKKILIKKEKRVAKKEKENVAKEWNKKEKLKVAKESIQKSARIVKKRRNTSVSVASDNGDPWNSLLSPWVDSYEEAKENQYSAGMRDLLSLTKTNGVLSDGLVTEKLLDQLCVVTDVKANRKGLVAKEQLHQGQAVIEFKGNVMLREHIDTENFMKKFHPFVLFYSNFENIDLCVDASAYGGEARFVRRSCAPNAEIQHVIEKGNIHFVIFAKKDIPQGGEITIPFDYSYKECSFNVECACLKAACPVSRFSKKLRISQNKESKQCVPASTPAPVVAPVVLPVREKKRTRRFSAPERESTRTKLPRLPPKSPVTPVASPVKQTVESRKAVSLEEPSPVKKEVVDSKQSPCVLEDQKSATIQSPEIQGLSESEQEAAERCKKMTREERKMEAIMKAFEKLAKREERRKEALARLETTKKVDGKDEEVPPPPVPVQEEPEEKPKPESPVKPTTPKGKKNKKHARRRSRINSAAAAMEMVSADENSNTGSMPGTPGPTPASADVASPNTAGFKFHKTKKHLFNEWMSERITDGKAVPSTVSVAAALAVGKTEPLEVSVDETMFVTCLPSPRNAMEHMPRRNSQSAGSVPQPITVQQPKSSNEHSIGSAKKRWLRQAMFETGPPSDSGSASPVHGGASPNPSACLPSPGGSPPADFVTPLKKRRLARESMSQEQPLTPTPSTPSPSVQPAGGSIDTSGGNVPGSPHADLEELQNKNGIRTLLPVMPEDKTDLSCHPAKRQRRESSHRESTDVDSDASESMLPPQSACHKSAEKDSDLAETSISSSEKDSSISETADSSADSSGIEVDIREQRSNEVADLVKQTNTCVEADSGEVQEIFAEHKDNEEYMDTNQGEQLLDQSSASAMASCDSQHSECPGESSVTASLNVSLGNKDDTNGEVTGSQGFEVSELTELSQKSLMVCPCSKESVSDVEMQKSADRDCKPSNDFECSADTDCKTYKFESTVDTDCHTSVSHDNVCDSASKSDAGAGVNETGVVETNPAASPHQPEENLCSVSSTVNKVEEFSPLPTPMERENNTCVVPDSQTGPSEAAAGYSHKVHQNIVMGNDDISAVSSTSVVDSSQLDDDPGVWLEPGDMFESEGDFNNPPLPSEPTPPPLPPDDMDVLPPLPPSPPPPPPPDPPTKKKVSLLEYRKRLKEKVKEPAGDTEATTPPPPPCPSQMYYHQHSHASRRKSSRTSSLETLSLAPLPLFEGASPIAKKGVNISPQKKEKKKKPEARKPMSLTERLRQEFGLDDTVEEDTSSKHEPERETNTPPPPPPPPPMGLSPPSSRKGTSEVEEDQNSPEDPPPPPSAPHPSQLKNRPGLLPHPTQPVNGSPVLLSHSKTPSGGPGILPHPTPSAVSGPVPLMSITTYPTIAAAATIVPPARGVSPVPVTNGPLHRNYPLLNGKASLAPQAQGVSALVPGPVQAPLLPTVGQQVTSPSPGSAPGPVPPPPSAVYHQAISSTSTQYAAAQTSNKASAAAFSPSLGAGFAPVGQHAGTPGQQPAPSLPYVAHVQARRETNVGQKFEYNHGLGTKPVHSPPQSSWNIGSSSHRQPPVTSHIQNSTSKEKAYNSPLSNYPSSTNHY